MANSIKLSIADALLSLCEEMPLEKITVSTIVTRAHVGRQTFYNHFMDKNDLIYWIFKRTLSGEKELIEHAGLYAYLTKLYRDAQKYRNFLKEACKQEGQNSLAEAIFNQTYRYYKNYIIKRHGERAITDDLEYALKFNAHGATALYVEWASQGMTGPAEQQARLALACMPQSVRELLPDN